VSDIVPGVAPEIVAPLGDPGPDQAPAKKPGRPQKNSKPLPWTGRIAAALLLLMVIIGVVGPLFTQAPVTTSTGRVTEGCGKPGGFPLYDPLNCADRNELNAQRRGVPSTSKFKHLLGVDGAGRDIFSQLVVGTRTSLLIAFASVGVSMLIGGALGVLAGYFRGKVDTVGSFLFDVLLAFPALILAIAILTFLKRSVPNMIATIAIVSIPLLGRISRASTLTWSEREFVTAAKALGAKHPRIIVREVLPNVLPAMTSIAFLAFGIVIVTEGSLSIVGLGVPDGDMSWGRVLAAGGADPRNYAFMALAAGTVITVAVMALNLLGDAVREKFDVKESAL
jgi:peptide/nickel transport system permease protein